jgi:hypothetical protein
MREELRMLRELLRLWDFLDDAIEYRLDIFSGLRRDWYDILSRAPEEVDHLRTHSLDVRTREVDLIQHWDDREIILEGEIDIRQGLCLDPLSRIDHEDRSLGRGETAGNFILEVDMSRGIDQVELDSFPLHPDRSELDRDTTLTLEIHLVKCLRLDLPLLECPRDLHESISERRFPMIDMGDDAEITDGTHSSRKYEPLEYMALEGKSKRSVIY